MTTGERLDVLERELAKARRTNHLMLGVVGAAVAVLGLAWMLSMTPTARAQGVDPESRDLYAESFTVVDEHGLPRATLGMLDGDGPVLSLYDEDHNPRASLSLLGNPIFALFDDSGETRVQIRLEDSDGGEPTLVMFDKGSTARVSLGVVEAKSGLLMFSERGQLCAGLTVTKDKPVLGMTDPETGGIWTAP